MNLTFLSLWERSSHANLGILYLSSYLKKYANIDKIRYLDQEKFSLEKLKGTKPDIVGLTAVTPNFRATCEVANLIKEELDIPIVIGGPHITSLPESLPDYIDAGIIGEGEETILELVKNDFSNLNEIQGIVHGSKINPRRPPIEPIDKIPFPDRDLLDKRYFGPHDILTTHENIMGTNMATSRGCPYRCVYCQSKILWQNARFHSAEYIADEIIMLKEKYRINALAIDDDLFIFKKDRLQGIIMHLKEAGILGEIKFNCTGRANMINDEIMRLLNKLNVVQINLGIESNSEKILKYLKKGTVTVKQNQRAVDLIHKHGMQAYCNFMLGSPHETMEDMQKTFDFYKKNKIETATVNITTPLPGTELWEWAKSYNLVSDDMNWNIFFNSLYKPEEQLYINEQVSHEEFIRFYKKFQQEIFNRTALRWKNLTIPMLIKKGIRQPKKSLNFLLHNIKGMPFILNKNKKF